MAKKQGDFTLYIREAVKRFPNLPNRTLAKKICNDSKTHYSIEEIRAKIKIIKGANGEFHRKATADKSQFTEKKTTTKIQMPDSYEEDYTAYDINQSKTLIISDLHLPYQNNKAIELALNFGLEKNVNCILINGDLMDFATISRFAPDWRNRKVSEEFETTRQFLKELRRLFPKTKIVYKLGNHDERWEKFLFLKAPEIFDDHEFRLETRLRLGELKIDIVKDKRPITIGKLTILHGHELAGGSGGVNPARSTFLKTLNSCVVGHFHKTSEHTEAQFQGDVISVKSIGCLCGLTPQYMPINKWNLGFGYCEMDIKTKEYTLSNYKIIKGKIYL